MLPDGSTLALFVAAALALLVTPGPAVLYIVARSLDQGRVAGLVSSAGLSCGGLVHVVAAALGLSAILGASATAFVVVKLAGALYLVYLGVRTLLGARQTPGRLGEAPRSRGRIFRDGVVVNLLNPKATLFFVAFLPQFTDPVRGPVSGQLLALGLLFLALGLVTDTTYALIAGSLGEWLGASGSDGAELRGGARLARVQRVVAGGVYLALGLAAALGTAGDG